LLELSAHIQPVDAREHEIEQDQTGEMLPCEREALVSIPGAQHIEPCSLEMMDEKLENVFVVFNDQNSRHRLARCRWRRSLRRATTWSGWANDGGPPAIDYPYSKGESRPNPSTTRFPGGGLNGSGERSSTGVERREWTERPV
jgi:hypothetical protein